MGRIDNLDESQIERLIRRVDKLERQNPIGFSSITRGALRVASPEGLIVEGSEKVTGTLDVTGMLTVSGTINGDGTIDWTGPVTFTGATNLNGPTAITGDTDITGDTTVTGPFHVQGPTDITGTLAVDGATTLSKDLTVGSGGRIILGTIVLNPTGGPGGSGLISSGTSIQVNAPTLAAQHDIFAGGNVTANGSVVAGGITGKGGVAANVYVDGSGKLFRVI